MKTKRIIALIMCPFLFLGLCFCSSQQEKVIGSTSVSEDYIIDKDFLSIESFCNKFMGCWGYRDNDGWQILKILDGRLSFFTYQGHMWDDGDIINIEQINNSITLTVLNKPFAWSDDVTEEIYEMEFVFKSNDNFYNSLVLELYDREESLLFLGTTIDEVDSIIGVFERTIILDEMSKFYNMAGLDWQSWMNYTNITFWDIISNYFDIDSLACSVEKEGLKTVNFMGQGESNKGNVYVYLSFVFANDTPMIVFNQMKNEDEILLNNAINEISEKYNVEYDVAMLMCDITSGTAFLASFL